ncbi:putative transcriptional regulatory protein [Vanrija pseudolonga]|uniref:Purtative transcriptional regulatory protein n=1 Tax=Vanrija pseudolonga TaxID=143232 RepID=A0AAF1BFX7_9TREE|nr:purtative transcriptional regulatory protein [Vanrija pseudolonga]
MPPASKVAIDRLPRFTEPPKPYKKRHYGQSCFACKERKIKCDGAENPPCKSCFESNTLCESGEKFKRKDKAGSSGRSETGEERPRRPKDRNDTEAIFADHESRLRELEELVRNAARTDRPGPSTEFYMEPAVGEPGYALRYYRKPVYHGELSMFDDESHRTGGPERPRSRSSSVAERDRPEVARYRDRENEVFIDDERRCRPFPPLHYELSPATRAEDYTSEELAALRRRQHKHASPEDGEAWLEAYFSWASLVDGFVDRQLFLRDMAVGGNYFSEFLLVCMYCTGIRLSYGMDERERQEKGDKYTTLALSMLGAVTLGRSCVASIQGLLLLSGRQIATGHITGSWMLAGTAIRMMQNIGIHLLPEEDPDTWSILPPEERDVRTRIFWAAYAWEKLQAMTLGRDSTLPLRVGHTPDTLPPDPDDELDWKPAVPEGMSLPYGAVYPSTPQLKMFTMRYYVRLVMLLDEVLANMYSPSVSNNRSLSFIRDAIEKLEAWWAALPDNLRIDEPREAARSPPPNIVIINLLYHTIKILVYRPLLHDSSPALTSTALAHCRAAAIATSDVLSLWVRTFGHNSYHYLFIYCTFIAAGVDIFLIRSGNQHIRDEALHRLQVAIATLEKGQNQAHAIRLGVINIRSQLRRATAAAAGEAASSEYAGPLSTTDSTPNQQLAQSSGHDGASELAPVLNAEVLDDLVMPWLDDQFDNQALMDMLRTMPISTNNPFEVGADQDLGFAFSGTF